MSIPRKTNLPAIPTSVDRSVKDALEVLTGQRRNAIYDSAITWRDALDIGFLKIAQGLASHGPGVAYADPGSLDYSTPPAITGLTAAGALASIILDWDQPVMSNYAHVEVWRAAADDLGQAAKVGNSIPSVYDDYIGGQAGYYYWVRAVSTADVAGQFNAVAGTYSETGYDPDYVMEVLTSAAWQASTAYSLYQIVDPSTMIIKGGKQLTFQCTVAGTSGTTEPSWGTVTGIGDTIVDNGVTWQAVEAGTAPFVIGTVDGQQVVAISSAVIQDASISNAKIALLAVDSARIADLAVVEAKIANAAITNAKIGNAAIDTAQIASAAITSAKIGTAEVETLNVAGNAITVPSGSYAATDVTLAVSGTYYNVGQLAIDSGGQPVNVMFSAVGYYAGISSGSLPIFTLRIVRGSTVLESSVSSVIEWGGALVFNYVDSSPPSGTNTYTIQAKFNWSAASEALIIYVKSRALTLLATKR